MFFCLVTVAAAALPLSVGECATRFDLAICQRAHTHKLTLLGREQQQVIGGDGDSPVDRTEQNMSSASPTQLSSAQSAWLPSVCLFVFRTLLLPFQP